MCTIGMNDIGSNKKFKVQHEQQLREKWSDEKIDLLEVLQACPDMVKFVVPSLALRAASRGILKECRRRSLMSMTIESNTPTSIIPLLVTNEASMSRDVLPFVAPVHLNWRGNPSNFMGESIVQFLDGVVWACDLLELRLHGIGLSIPDIENVTWPQNLLSLEFGKKFNQSLSAFKWPKTLKSLVFGRNFNHTLSETELPDCLEELVLGAFFEQPIVDVVWPKSLKILRFGRNFDGALSGTHLPDCLEKLVFGKHFNQPIVDVSWPRSLKTLIFQSGKFDGFNQSLTQVEFPNSLEDLELGNSFSSEVAGVKWSGLKRLVTGTEFDSSIDGVQWSDRLEYLDLRGRFNQYPGNLPKSLQVLKFGDRFNQPIIA